MSTIERLLTDLLQYHDKVERCRLAYRKECASPDDCADLERSRALALLRARTTNQFQELTATSLSSPTWVPRLALVAAFLDDYLAAVRLLATELGLPPM